jgi:hypothetical protein
MPNSRKYLRLLLIDLPNKIKKQFVRRMVPVVWLDSRKVIGVSEHHRRAKVPAGGFLRNYDISVW